MADKFDAEHLNTVLSRRGAEQLNRRLSQAPGAFKGSPRDSLTSAEGGVLAEPYETPFLLAADVERNARDAGTHPGDPELVRTALEAFGQRHIDDTDSGIVQGGRYVVAPSAPARRGQYVVDGRTALGRHLRAVPRREMVQQPAAVTVNLAKSYPLTERERLELERRNLLASGVLTWQERLALEPDLTPAQVMTRGWDD